MDKPENYTRCGNEMGRQLEKLCNHFNGKIKSLDFQFSNQVFVHADSMIEFGQQVRSTELVS